MRKIERRFRQLCRELGIEVRKVPRRWLDSWVKRKRGNKILGRRVAGPVVVELIRPRGQKVVAARTDAKRRAIRKEWPRG